jgi:hypothetical protein
MGDSEITSAEVGGFNVETNTGESSEEITKALADPDAEEDEAEDLSEAASELGKKGGKAAAKARKAKAKEAQEAEEEPEEKAEESEDEPERKASEDDEDSEDEDSEDKPEKEESERQKRKRDARTRVLEATRQAAEAKRERDQYRQELEELRSKVAKLEKPEEKQEAKPSEDREPQEDDFDNYRDYVRAAARWEIRQELKQTQQRQQQEALDRRLNEQIEKFGNAIKPHVENFSPEVLSLKTEFQLQPNEKPVGQNWIANELFSSPESAPTLMLHLSEHPDELQRLAALPTPRDVTREMAILVTRLTAATPTGSNGAEREEVSKAKPPVKPVAGAPYVADGPKGPRDGEDFDSWLKRTGQIVLS